ncbi:TonB-dependent receptor [Stenotrophomonas sp. ATCM1_4]|jgi:iron complex outermembrane receptor protein|uniref:TonB-dependent receptor n=1 Tax=Stenotrophomonas capsici TaxID=3110230 RepID=A0ABU5V265_9GAMM|nr:MULTISPECIES: TonB-dependent receptor [unclassified Stenotrophomonas]MEA5667444.1 TonB-dependent receptor [Stenotrophomonas sp. MH1]TDB28305.1 TonB-dependent receptor [Stenotrophomonas sp. ATCM1_4]
MKRKYLSMAIGGILLAPAAFVQAQEQQATAAGTQATQLDEVTVTARRRSESIQDVPVAVSAFGEEQIKDLQASTVEGLQGAVPNMNIAQGRGSANSVNVFIRGIGQPDALQTFDPGVGMYVDDVYYSRINGALFSLFDIQQLEVLRGPQGTLYGKNSTGGAIKLTTKNPFDNEGGAVEVTAGDYGRLEGRFYVSGQLSDTVAGSIAGAKITNDGYVKDADTGKRYNDDDTEALRLKLAFKPTDNFSAVLSLDTTKQDAALTLGRPMANLVQTSLAPGGAIVLKPGETGEWNRRARTSFDDGQGQYLKHSGASLAMDWDINEQWTLKSISSYRKLKTESYIDIDASEYELGDVLVALDQNQKSQEFQLHYDNGSNLHATFGAYYMKENVPSYQEAYADDLFSFLGAKVPFLRTIDDDLTTTSTAAFAHVNWEFVPSWTVAAGVRWTKDKKDYERSTSTFWGAPFAGLNGTVAFDAKASWTAVTPSISLQKAFSDNLMGYVSANRGFKSGGFNGRANTVYDTEHAKFDPEYVWTYELGLKGSSADHRFRGSAAAFYSNYSDFQARVSQDVGTFPVLNAAKLNIKGIELEGSALLGESTTLSAQVGWMDAKYDKFEDFRLDPSYPGFDPNVSHAHVPFSPDWTARVALQHVFPLGDSGSLTLGGDVSYRSETWLSVDNRAVLSQDAYTLLGAYGVWDSPQMSWQVRAGVRNLTDKQYMTEGQEFASVGNIQTAYYGLPRNWYVSVRYNF